MSNYLLHIDTSGDTGIVFLAAEGKALAHRDNTDTRNQAAYINNMITKVLAEAGATLADLSGVVVCAGPGSYTGLRIGMATAKAICYVNNIPLFLDNRLTLLANQATKQKEGYDSYMAVLIARENEYFVAAYSPDLQEVLSPVHLSGTQLTEIIAENKNILVTGNINEEDLINMGINTVYMVYNNMLDMDTWAQYGFQQYKCNRSVNLASAEPFYLKQVYTHKPKDNK